VIVAAGALGTQALLMDLRARGRLPALSPALGRHVRTNAESLIGIRWPGDAEDLSQGIAIGSGIHLDEHTHVEATRYPAGADAMALLSTVMGAGAGRGAWLGALLRGVLTRPRQTWRLLRPRHRARIPSHIPLAHAFAQQAAAATGGVPMASLPEVLFHVPMTAHCLGGAVMAATPRDGVCDHRNRVFGYRNLYLCDGSTIGANLGVNPSLTITALAERAMHHIPAAEHQTWSATGEALSR